MPIDYGIFGSHGDPVTVPEVVTDREHGPGWRSDVILVTDEATLTTQRVCNADTFLVGGTQYVWTPGASTAESANKVISGVSSGAYVVQNAPVESFGPFTSIAEFRAATPPSVLTSFTFADGGAYDYRTDWGANVTDDGYYVLKPDSVAADANGRAVRRRESGTRPEHIYGNTAAARAIVSVTTAPMFIFLCGDSRSVPPGGQSEPMKSSPDVMWGGWSAGTTQLSLAGLATHTVQSPGYTSNPAAMTETVAGHCGRISAESMVHTVFADGTSPDSDNTKRFLVNTPLGDSVTVPYILRPYTANGMKMSVIIRTGPTGVTTNVIHIQAGKAAVTDLSTDFATYAASLGWQKFSLTLPAGRDWTTAYSFGLCYKRAQAVRAGETVTTVAYFTESNGVVWINTSGAGRGIPHYARADNEDVRYDDFFAPELWTNLIPLYGANRALWISLGTNNTLNYTVDQQIAGYQRLIARFRAGTPNGPVIIDTAYAGQINLHGASPYWREAAIKLTELDPMVTMVDTYRACWNASWEVALAAGYMTTGDGVHATATGHTEWCKQRIKLLAAAGRS